MVRAGAASSNDERVNIGGVPIDCLTRSELTQKFLHDLSENKGRDRLPVFSTSANGHVLALAERNEAFRDMLLQADHIDADGMPLVIASRYLARRALPERIATTDFIHDLAKLSAKTELRFFLLGATADENARAIATLKALYPRLNISGYHGFWGDADAHSVMERIKASEPDILWVGLGVPREHAFVLRFREELRGVTWIKTCGGLFNFLSGSRKRAPLWMQAMGFEWAWRMAQEPKRLGPRYVLTNGKALQLLWRYRGQ